VDPDLCVAAGSAIQASVIAGQQVASVLVDITPYTFGTSALGDLNGEVYPHTFVPLIRKNTAIPVTKSEAFNTVYDGQEAIDVTVYQGEDPDALNNTEIGSFLIEGLSDVPAGNVIVTTFSLDLNGILHVSSREKRTGLEKRIRIENATTRFEQQEMAAARERIGALLPAHGEDVETGTQRKHVQSLALIEKAERLMDTAVAEDQEDLVDLTEQLRDALSAGDVNAQQQASGELSDLIFYLDS
jgi:molecular chaperone DnaK (HSP70)